MHELFLASLVTQSISRCLVYVCKAGTTRHNLRVCFEFMLLCEFASLAWPAYAAFVGVLQCLAGWPALDCSLHCTHSWMLYVPG
jgi:NADH:ubiquinone oxidoreductase subunit 4 (subunit M)